LITAGPKGEDQRPFAPSGLVFSGIGGATPRFSPDGRRLAFTAGPPTLRAIWVVDLSSGTRLKLTPGDSNDHSSVSWSPDSKSILYRVLPREGFRASQASIWSQAADGSRSPVLVSSASRTRGRLAEARFTPDGRGLVYAVRTDETASDIWYRALQGDTIPRPLRVTTADEVAPEISPDGKWMAYSSNESGTFEVYVTSLPSAAERWPISVGGGRDPMWSPDGKSITYLTPTGRQVLRSFVQLGPEIRILRTDTLFSAPVLAVGSLRNYDINPRDGRFIIVQRSDSVGSLVAIVNMFADKRLSARGR
jgi:Tol biopolymer transport system component